MRLKKYDWKFNKPIFSQYNERGHFKMRPNLFSCPEGKLLDFLAPAVKAFPSM
jgi:hypothetical protein